MSERALSSAQRRLLGDQGYYILVEPDHVGRREVEVKRWLGAAAEDFTLPQAWLLVEARQDRPRFEVE